MEGGGGYPPVGRPSPCPRAVAAAAVVVVVIVVVVVFIVGLKELAVVVECEEGQLGGGDSRFEGCPHRLHLRGSRAIEKGGRGDSREGGTWVILEEGGTREGGKG